MGRPRSDPDTHGRETYACHYPDTNGGERGGFARAGWLRGVLTPASWQALAGSNAVVDHDENTPPSGLTAVAHLQYGALDCQWDGLADTNAPGSLLDVSVAPDATALFNRNFDAIMKNEILGRPHPIAIQGLAGDKNTAAVACTRLAGGTPLPPRGSISG